MKQDVLISPLYGRVFLNKFLSRFTSMGISANADIWMEPNDTAQLRSLIKHVNALSIPVIIIGTGCNMIIANKNINSMFIRLNAPAFRKMEFKDNLVKVWAGVFLHEFLFKVCGNSLSGAEFLAGIPGTIGGAIYGNAGLKDLSISNIVEELEVVTPQGELKILKRNQINFSYRKSDLDGYIIISAVLKLYKTRADIIMKLIDSNISNKLRVQDYTAPSAGCAFKNPINHAYSAGQIIDKCGLKGRKRGGARVSKKHANFILNTGNAKPGDVVNLIKDIKKRVKSVYGIDLQEEVRILSK